ncbi:MAG TPA: hypothetical protein VG106_10805, partial [Vicinamibacterales bacterium]|nr:hypothetical protein [Vicinamibacterales bacterium]
SLVSTYVLGWVGTELDEMGTALAGRAETTSSSVIQKASRGTARLVASSTILKETAGYLADQKMTLFGLAVRDPSRWHVIVLRGTSELVLAVFIAMMLLVAYIMSRLLNVNIYSMHGMYRNRLIRAYLGASRWSRRPDPFTGFDPQDNVKMWQLQPEALWSSSFIDFDAFVHALLEKQGDEQAKPRSVYWQLPADLRTRLFVYDVGRKVALRGMKAKAPARQDVESDLIDALNTLLVTRDIERDLEAEASIALLRDNRRYLERCFAGILDHCPDDRSEDEIEKHRVADNELVVGSVPRLRNRPPLHVVNTALNLVGGDKLAWRERKADSFTITPLHAGNKRLGYRPSTSYGEEISLGTSIAISGAAVSPNHGYNSSPIVTFLMTLFNARLGWWLGNPGRAGNATYDTAGPRHSLKSIVDEALGRTNDTSDYVFLSDGGHFDNLGLYEMVLRRCRYIVVCDASQDERYAFGDLANAVRKIRVDLGIDIRLKSMFIGGDDDTNKYCALGCIDYIDRSRPQKGFLLYIKPAVYADCPTDVRNYRQENKPFPHESTADQFFSESQFESYRALGQHGIRQICSALGGSDRDGRTVWEFFSGASRYLQEKAKEDEAVRFFVTSS